MNEELVVRENHQLIEGIRLIEVQKKSLESREKEMRAKLLEAMQEYGVWDLENDSLKITRIPATTRESVDVKALKKDFPTIAKKMMKVTDVKESLRFKVKQ